MKVNRYQRNQFVSFEYETLAFVFIVICYSIVILLFGHSYDNFINTGILFYLLLLIILFLVLNFIEINSGLKVDRSRIIL